MSGRMAQVWNIWTAGHQPFAEVGSDTFQLATPSGNMLWTCDHSVINQLFIQNSKALVAVDLIKFFDLWGPTLGSVEGNEWKIHRKVVTAAFNQGSNKAVWKESILQSHTLVDRWIEREQSIVPVVKKWTSRLALHVISSLFFDKHLDWKLDHDTSKANRSSVKDGPHRIGYEEALFTVLERLGTIYVTPKALLKRLPGKFFQEASTAYTEWTRYMEELRDETVARLDDIATKKNKSILGQASHPTPSPDCKTVKVAKCFLKIFSLTPI